MWWWGRYTGTLPSCGPLHLWGWKLASERAGWPHCTRWAAYERGCRWVLSCREIREVGLICLPAELHISIPSLLSPLAPASCPDFPFSPWTCRTCWEHCVLPRLPSHLRSVPQQGPHSSREEPAHVFSQGACVCSVAHLCLTLCDPLDCSCQAPLSVREIL